MQKWASTTSYEDQTFATTSRELESDELPGLIHLFESCAGIETLILDLEMDIEWDKRNITKQVRYLDSSVCKGFENKDHIEVLLIYIFFCGISLISICNLHTLICLDFFPSRRSW